MSTARSRAEALFALVRKITTQPPNYQRSSFSKNYCVTKIKTFYNIISAFCDRSFDGLTNRQRTDSNQCGTQFPRKPLSAAFSQISTFNFAFSFSYCYFNAKFLGDWVRKFLSFISCFLLVVSQFYRFG